MWNNLEIMCDILKLIRNILVIKWDNLEIMWDILVIKWDILEIMWDILVIKWDILEIMWDIPESESVVWWALLPQLQSFCDITTSSFEIPRFPAVYTWCLNACHLSTIRNIYRTEQLILSNTFFVDCILKIYIILWLRKKGTRLTKSMSNKNLNLNR